MGRRSTLAAAAAVSVTPVVATRWCFPPLTIGVATAIALAWILGAAAFDMVWGQLPDSMLALSLGTVVMAAVVHPLRGSLAALPGSGGGAALWAVPLLAVHVAAPHALGFGDVKAAATIGALLGLALPLSAVGPGLLLAIGLAALVAIASGRRLIALGPFLAFGASVSLLVGPLVGGTMM